MNISYIEQRSPEWYQLRKGKISGTRAKQLVSNRKNRLMYELLDERLSDMVMPDVYINDDMQFGIDTEPMVFDMYRNQSGIDFKQVGAILSDFSPIHMASPDGLEADLGIVLEIKCTLHGAVQVMRYFDGVDPDHMGQIVNYFAVSDDVREVHYVSYCPNRPERPLVVHLIHREAHVVEIDQIRRKVKEAELTLAAMEQSFKF